MPAPVYLQSIDGRALHTENLGPTDAHLITEDHSRVGTQFKVAGTTSAATTTIVEPRAGSVIVITDLTVNQDKIASGVVTVQFTDGTNDEILFKAATSDAPVTAHMAYAGRMRGWVNAKIEMISAGTNPVTNVTVVYYHLLSGGGAVSSDVLSFDDWNAQR